LASLIVPMVSFCDIPLSQIKDHISKYGNYGIGMTKEWAIKNGLNPVLYMTQNSMLSESYRKAWNKTAAENSHSEKWTEDEYNLCDILRYVKNYEGDLKRKDTVVEDYRFSDEREWRYAPPFSEEYEFLLSQAWYNEGSNKKKTDDKLEDLRLGFTPSDIKYIIISKDAEIGEFIDHLRRCKGKSFTLHEIERLTTRILTAEQILTDV